MLCMIPISFLYIVLFTFTASAEDMRIAQAEQLYAQRSDLSRVSQAISLLTELIQETPKNYEVQWRLAKYYYFLGKHVTNKEEKFEAFEKGIEAGKQAVLLQPPRPEGHFWLAANYGTYGREKGILKSLMLVKPMRQELEAAIRIDPLHENGSAYAILGKLDSEVPRLFGGSLKRGIDYLEKAVKIGPDNSLAKLFLAESYLYAKRKEEAKQLLEEILTMAPDKNYEFEFTENQQEARRLLAKNFE
ncbi:MAG: tetratricopeptide repeat protein [Candidatus Tectomicrobia bacterium]|nr:tetratricopeptide repeat protein [Candidatus Tectomicrobia bacterium]